MKKIEAKVSIQKLQVEKSANKLNADGMKEIKGGVMNLEMIMA